jgi:hypothetical protein
VTAQKIAIASLFPVVNTMRANVRLVGHLSRTHSVIMKDKRFLLFCSIAALMTLGAFYSAYLDDLANANSLSFLTPLISLGSLVGEPLFTQVYPLWRYGTGLVCLILLAVGLRRRSGSQMLFFAGLVVAILAQLVLVDRVFQKQLSGFLGLIPPPNAAPYPAIALGVILYLVSFVLVNLGLRRADAPQFEDLRSREEPTSRGEFVALLAIFSIAVILRVFALNRITNYFEGECAAFSAAAGSLEGMFVANRGLNGPWSPLGILYYLPMSATFALFDTTLLSVRLGSVLIGLMTIPIMHLCAKRIAGKTAGIVAALILTFNCLHLGWHRSDIYPHGATTWPTVLMAYCLLRAAETRRLTWAAGVALMMGISWHQYPSGQSAVVMPLLALGFFWLNNRCRLPLTWGQCALVLSGVVLWGLGIPLSYYPATGKIEFMNPLTLTGGRTLWGDGSTCSGAVGAAICIVKKSSEHTWDVIQGLFFKAPYLFHQEWVPSTEYITPRTMEWPVVACAVVGLFFLVARRRSMETAVLLGWIGAALLPGILSEQAYPKRLSSTFPAIMTLAAITAAVSYNYIAQSRWRAMVCRIALPLTMIVWAGVSCFAWFSGRFWHYGEAPEIAMAKEIARDIPAGTLTIGAFGENYDGSKFTLLLLDHLTDVRNRPNLLGFSRFENLPKLIENPQEATTRLGNSWVYSWTKMRSQLQETVENRSWQRVTYLITDTFHNSKINGELIQSAITHCKNPSVRTIESSANTPTWKILSVTSISCAMSDRI